MSKKKQLHNRLNDLFADMGEEENQISDNGQPAESKQKISGWNWQCDAVGYYTACSPEVENILGVEASKFLGKLLTTYQLSSTSSKALIAALEEGENTSLEINLEYKRQNGEYVPVLTKIFRQDSDSGAVSGWHGFSQVIQPGTESLPPLTSEKSQGFPETKRERSEAHRIFSADKLGIALEDGEARPVNSPYSGAGKQSLKQRQAVSYPSAPGIEAALAVPFTLADESLGLLEIIDSDPDRKWNPDEQLLVEEVANQLSLALENAQLFQETQFSLARTEALFRVGQAAIAIDDLQELLLSVANTIAEVMPARRTIMVVCDQRNKEEITHLIQSQIGPVLVDENTHQQFMGGLTGWAIREQKPVLSNLRTDDPRESKAARAIRHETDAGSVIIAPMIYREDVFGAVTAINSFTEAEFTQADLDLLTAMANQIAAALANSQLFQQVTSRSEELALINRIVTKITGTLEINEALQTIVREIGQAIYAQVHIGLFNKAKTKTRIAAFFSPVPEVLNLVGSEFDIEYSFGPATDIVKVKSVIFDDVQHDPNLAQNHAEYRERNVFSLATFPISISDDVIGLMTVETIERGRRFAEEEIRLIQAIITQTSTAIQSANLFQAEQRRRRIAATLSEIARTIGGSLELAQIAERLLVQLTNVVEFDSASLQIIEGDRRESIGSINEKRTETINQVLSFRPISEDPLILDVVESKQPVVLNDTFADNRWDRLPENQQIRSWIATPLLRGQEVIGLLILDHGNPGAFDEETVDLLSGVAAQASVAIHNARLYQQAQARSAQLQTAAEVSRAASSILDPNPLIEQTVNLIRDRFDLYYVGIFIIDASGQTTREPGKWAVLRAGTGEAGQIQLERAHKLEVNGTSMIGQCVATSQPQISQQVETRDQRFINPLLPETRSEIALPLISRGQVIGAMTIQSTEPAAFSNEDIVILQTMADQIANALQNASLFDQTQIRAEELAVLNEMSRQLTSTVDLAAITHNLYLFASRLIDTSTFFIALYDEKTDSLTFPFATEDNQEVNIKGNVPSRGLSKYVIDNREALLVTDNIEEWLKNHDMDAVLVGDDETTLTAQSWLGVPMLAGDNVIGIINVQHKNPHHYVEQDYELLMAIASQGAIAFQNASLFAETRQRTEDLATLNELSREMASLLDIEMVLEKAYQYTSILMDTTNFFIALYNAQIDEITLPLVILKNEPVEVSPRKVGEGLSDYVIRHKIPLLLNGEDIIQQMEEIGIERVSLGEGLPPKSWLGVPMMIGGEVIGVINVQSVTTPYLYQERQRDLLISIASQLAITIQNTHLFAQTQQQLTDLTIIQETTSRLAETLNMDEVVRTVLEQTAQAAQADSGNLYLLRNNYLTRVGFYPQNEDQEASIGVEIYLDDLPITKKVVETREPSITFTDDPALLESSREVFRAAGIAVNANFPMIGPEGVVGILALNRLAPAKLFNPEETNLVGTLANQAAASLENARLYEEIRETAEQLREVDTLKSQFLANMSHELRTPLNSIIGFSRVIMKGIDGPVTDMQQQDLSAIYNAGQHLLNMINDILDISKIEAGKMELAIDDIDIPSIVESVLSTARGLVKDKPIKLITEIEDDIPIVTADPTRIRQILLNLISNSAKFTDEGSITVTVHKQTKEEGGRELYIAVADTGTGIAEEDQNKLFVPFSQVDGSPTRKVEGTGLGLSITRLLIELHGGEIGVDSTLGAGCTFWFTIPLPEEDTDHREGNGALTVLAIDDDPQVLSLYERYLSSAGFQVIPVTDPREALKEAQSLKPFAITLDIMMPDFDGWQLLKDLKTDPKIGSTPVVICSILAEHEKGMRLGATDYLTKPILEDDLIHALNKLREPS